MPNITIQFHPVLGRVTPLPKADVVACTTVEEALDAVFAKYPALVNAFLRPPTDRQDLFARLLKYWYVYINDEDIHFCPDRFQTRLENRDTIYIGPILAS